MSGPPWDARKDGLVDGRGERRLDVRVTRPHPTSGGSSSREKDQPAARSAQRLVRRRRDDVRWGTGWDAGRRDEPRDVGHVDEQQRTNAVGIAAIRSKSMIRGTPKHRPR